MKIHAAFLRITTLSLVSVLSACNLSGASNDTLVMDLDAIASATGQADVIKQQVNAANQELNNQLDSISQQLSQQLTDEREKLGKKLSQQEEDSLKQLTLAANQKMQQARSLAAQKSQQYKNALIIQLRQQVTPIAEAIAQRRNASVVMITTPSMMWYDPEADITAEIIAELRTNRASGTNENKTQSTEDSVRDNPQAKP